MAAPPRSRRADILKAAEREFGSAGFFGARIERIAETARVNKQLLFHYFKSKEGLFAAALAGMLPAIEPPAGVSSPAEAVRELLGRLQQVAAGRPGLVGVAADARANAEFPREARELLRAWVRQAEDHVAALVSDGQSRGYFRDDIDPVAVARVGCAAALGSAITTDGSAPSVGSFVLDHCTWR